MMSEARMAGGATTGYNKYQQRVTNKVVFSSSVWIGAASQLYSDAVPNATQGRFLDSQSWVLDWRHFANSFFALAF